MLQRACIVAALLALTGANAPAWAQSGGEQQREAPAKGKKRKQNKRPPPQLEGPAAILFESPLPPEVPIETPRAEPGEAGEADEPGESGETGENGDTGETGDNAEYGVPEPGATEAEPDAGAAAAEEVPELAGPPLPPEVVAPPLPPGPLPPGPLPPGPLPPGQEGPTIAEGTTPQTPAPPAAAAFTPPPLVGGDEEYPFLGEDVEGLIQTTDQMLASLPPLEVPIFDPELLQLGFSWNLGFGTGTVPGREAQVAQCGLFFNAARAGAQFSQPEEIWSPTCCTFDDETLTYACGDRDLFPNRLNEGLLDLSEFALNDGLLPVDTWRAADGTEQVLVCLDVDEATLQELSAAGERYAGNEPFRQGEACCAVDWTYVEANSSNGNIDLGRVLSQCAPSSVATATGLGNAGGAFAAQAEVYAEGELFANVERRSYAYSVGLDGRVGFLTSINANDTAGTPNTFGLRARFATLRGDFRWYITPDVAPWFLLAQADIDGMLLDYQITEGGSDLGTYTMPIHGTIGGGYGRIYDIEPRIKLRKLEAMLQTHGVIRERIPDDVARQIMIAWWALRSELGSDQRLLYTMKILKDAGLLAGPVTAAVVYRFVHILEDPQLALRRQGSDSRLQVRVGKRLQTDAAGTFQEMDATVVIEAHDHRIFNLDYDTELFWDASIAVAPRPEDYPDNQLQGKPVQLTGLLGGMLMINVPVGLRLYRYDDYMNKDGLWELQARAAFAFAEEGNTVPTAPQGFGFSVGASVAYTFFHSKTSGLSFVVDADVGLLNENAVFAVTGGVSMTFGHAESYYVAPGEVVDAMPFDMPLPLPRFIKGAQP